MDDFELLHDDHSLLSSQVVHVIALIKSLGDNHQPSVPLFSEIIRQMGILRNQLLEHFAFEEEEAFPRLDDKYPTIRARLHQLLEQHDKVLAAFDDLRAALRAEPRASIILDTSASCDMFEAAFEHHAAEEAKLLRQLAAAAQ